MLLCPPQHGKSTLASKRAPAFLLGLRPEIEIISASASAPLAEEFGGDVRNCIASPEYQTLFPQVRLSEDSQAKGRWRTDQGGGYYAVGIGGALMGRGGEFGIVDDPFSSWEDSQSELSRKRVWDWYTGTFYNRIRPGGSIVVIQHRMHEDDLVGLLIRAEQHGGDRWRVIKLPADLDNPPWPERYDRAALERLKANTDDPRKWSALYMQDPSPEEGEYFKREWFRFYKDAPRSLNVYMSGDFAVSDEQGDYTELAVWGVDSLDNIYALDWWSGRKTADVWTDAILDLAARWKPLMFIGESGPIRRAVEPLLDLRMRERGIYVATEWLASTKDKTVQARPIQGMLRMGRVYFPSTDWAGRVIDQCLRFPGGRYDDAVDACALFGRHIARTWAAADEAKPKPQINWDAPMRISDMFKSSKRPRA